MTLMNMNLEEFDAFLPQNGYEENAAILTHYLMMNNGKKKTMKKKVLVNEYGFEEGKLKQAEKFYNELDFPFQPQDNPNFTFIDLFAGIGGFRLAMQAHGGKCVFSSEWDKAAKQTYFNNYGEVPFGDITKPEIKAQIPDNFDVLCAGFPCQPFSNIGLRKGIEDTRGTLFYHIAEILKEKRPKAVFLENVRGLISNDEGRTLKVILQTITGMGYVCNISQETIENGPIANLKKDATKLVFNPKEFGIPQNRPRIYIVLWRADLNLEKFDYPKPTHEKTRVGQILERGNLEKYTISDKLWEGFERRKKRNEEKGNGFSYSVFNADSSYTSALLRRYYKDGHEILISQKEKKPRKLTPREAANLQGFPRSFKLPLSTSSAYQQFGNSVAVPLVDKVAEQIVNQILSK